MGSQKKEKKIPPKSPVSLEDSALEIDLDALDAGEIDLTEALRRINTETPPEDPAKKEIHVKHEPF